MFVHGQFSDGDGIGNPLAETSQAGGVNPIEVVPLRLLPSDDLRQELEAWMGEQDEHAGCPICGVGSRALSQLRLAAARVVAAICDDLEILSLSSPPFSHGWIGLLNFGTKLSNHL